MFEVTELEQFKADKVRLLHECAQWRCEVERLSEALLNKSVQLSRCDAMNNDFIKMQGNSGGAVAWQYCTRFEITNPIGGAPDIEILGPFLTHQEPVETDQVNIVPLYTSPQSEQAGVPSSLIKFIRDFSINGLTVLGKGWSAKYSQGYVQGWNACKDAIAKELATPPAQAEEK